MTQTIVDAIAKQLDADTAWTYSPTTDLPAGSVPISVGGMPAKDPMGGGAAVCLTTYGSGPEPDSRNGWEYPRLQVKVRHANALEAMALDRVAYEALQFSPADTPKALPGSTWTLTDCYALQSEPQPLGRDDGSRWEYVRNYQLTTEAS